MARRSWSGSKVRRARRIIAATLPAPCWRCGRMLYAEQPGAWVVGHLIEADLRPDLEDDQSLWAAECKPCSDRSGAIYGNRKRAGRPRQVTSRVW